MALLSFFLSILAVCAALPANNPSDPVISTLGGDERFQYMRSADGTPHLVDTWLKVSDLQKSARFDPDTENVYHLFTRANPSVSQPLLLGGTALLEASNYDSSRRTIVFVHGWTDSASGNANTVLVPAFLAAEDVNMISVDWSTGSSTTDYYAAVVNTVTAGESVARFVNWLNALTGSTPAQYHILGHSLGGQMSGIIARNVDGDVAYVTALDPALPGWESNINRFQEADADYTEVIHTNAGMAGFLTPLGDVDFYPNGGMTMPGCAEDQGCDHDRCYYYMAESLTSGGFTGTQCDTYLEAIVGNCTLSGRLEMGGLQPKTGSTGIYYLETNASPPFSIG